MRLSESVNFIPKVYEFPKSPDRSRLIPIVLLSILTGTILLTAFFNYSTSTLPVSLNTDTLEASTLVTPPFALATSTPTITSPPLLPTNVVPISNQPVGCRDGTPFTVQLWIDSEMDTYLTNWIAEHPACDSAEEGWHRCYAETVNYTGFFCGLGSTNCNSEAYCATANIHIYYTLTAMSHLNAWYNNLYTGMQYAFSRSLTFLPEMTVGLSEIPYNEWFVKRQLIDMGAEILMLWPAPKFIRAVIHLIKEAIRERIESPSDSTFSVEYIHLIFTIPGCSCNRISLPSLKRLAIFGSRYSTVCSVPRHSCVLMPTRFRSIRSQLESNRIKTGPDPTEQFGSGPNPNGSEWTRMDPNDIRAIGPLVTLLPSNSYRLFLGLPPGVSSSFQDILRNGTLFAAAVNNGSYFPNPPSNTSIASIDSDFLPTITKKYADLILAQYAFTILNGSDPAYGLGPSNCILDTMSWRSNRIDHIRISRDAGQFNRKNKQPFNAIAKFLFANGNNGKPFTTPEEVVVKSIECRANAYQSKE
ncbi:hypothetical protein BC938DRAFT_480229 [Jimgerdemannia flammicorona]|uniref:Uncharacterized protein n=1 Tax=Jimgerdemannia flammicorona TaxID=994334 RepID=A0A433QIZ6_9FUNG|nr:hypothetical protein BC938DRAFT_480229 [Jimgerdemannia flammicorona]